MTQPSKADIAAAIHTATPRRPNPSDVDVEHVLATTARLFAVTGADLTGPSRNRRLVEARQVAMTVLRHATTLSYPELGRLFGRDHTTVIHAVRRTLDQPAMRAWAAAVDAELHTPPTPPKRHGCRRRTPHHGGTT